PSAKNSGKPYYVCNQENRCKFFEFEEKAIERLRNLGVIKDSNPSPLLFNMDQPNVATHSAVKRKATSDDDDEISFWTSAPKNKDAGPITEHMSRQDRLLLASNKRIKFLLDEWNGSKDELKRQKQEIEYLRNRIQEIENDRSSISQTYANELYKNRIDLVSSNAYNTQLLKEIETLKISKDLEISRLSQMVISYEKQLKDDNDQINNLVIQNNHLADANRCLVQKCSLTNSQPTNFQDTQEFKRLSEEILSLKSHILELEKSNDLLKRSRNIENSNIDPVTVTNEYYVKHEPIDLKFEP
ncbi:15283_t:CDS:2, partial [Racocetra fulgida]